MSANETSEASAPAAIHSCPRSAMTCGRPLEVLGGEEVAHRLLPLAAVEEVAGHARVLGGHPRPPDLGAQPPAQETLEERVEAVLLAPPVSSPP